MNISHILILRTKNINPNNTQANNSFCLQVFIHKFKIFHLQNFCIYVRPHELGSTRCYRSKVSNVRPKTSYMFSFYLFKNLQLITMNTNPFLVMSIVQSYCVFDVNNREKKQKFWLFF